MPDERVIGEVSGSTHVNGKMYDWRVDVQKVKWPLRCRRLVVEACEGSQPPLACTFMSLSGKSEVTDERIGAIIQFALLLGWESSSSFSLGTQEDPNPSLMGYLKNLGPKERQSQAAIIDPFESERHNYYNFPAQISMFFTNKEVQTKYHHDGCRCKCCTYVIHNKRCPECGDLYRTAKGSICAHGHKAPST